MVTQVANEKALDAMVKASSSITFDVLPHQRGEIFWIVPLVDNAAVQLYSVVMDENSFKLRRGERDARLPGEQILRKGEAFVLRMRVSEGIPNLVVCLTDMGSEGKERICWTPRFNGGDGALTLDPGFVPLPTAAHGAVKFEQAETPLLEGGVLNDDALVMVKTITDKSELDAIKKHFSLTLLGEFKPAEPNTLLLLPIVEPLSIEVWTVEHTVSIDDDIAKKEKLATYTLKNNTALVFSARLMGIQKGKDGQGDEPVIRYAFVARYEAGHIEDTWWAYCPSGNCRTENWSTHFIPWSFD
jgi:hypothetical protein